jgi:hypothetical protein
MIVRGLMTEAMSFTSGLSGEQEFGQRLSRRPRSSTDLAAAWSAATLAASGSARDDPPRTWSRNRLGATVAGDGADAAMLDRETMPTVLPQPIGDHPTRKVSARPNNRDALPVSPPPRSGRSRHTGPA